MWGPLGNGFPADPVEHLILVGGGIGQTPFLAYARESLGRRQYGDPVRSQTRAEKVTLCYGARRADYLAGVGDFEQLGVDVHLSTDDGSAGHHGFVTEYSASCVGITRRRRQGSRGASSVAVRGG